MGIPYRVPGEQDNGPRHAGPDHGDGREEHEPSVDLPLLAERDPQCDEYAKRRNSQYAAEQAIGSCEATPGASETCGLDCGEKKLMAVEFDAGSGKAGATRTVAQTRIVGAALVGHQYDVAPDGRFLVNVRTSDSAPLTVMSGWEAALK
jgi:uncharacterized low-complexity protein